MSQPKRPDISTFFTPSARQIIPRKRSTPESDDDDIIIVREASLNKSPSGNHVDDTQGTRSTQRRVTAPSQSALTTPRTDRTISIPIRSPSITTPGSTATVKRTRLFDISKDAIEKAPSAFSFADTAASKRKVIEDGKLVAVRDSDESDNESLESLTDIFERKPTKSVDKKAETALRQEEERVRLLSMYTGARSMPIVNRDKMRALQRKQKETRFDMRSILDEDLKDEQTRARISQLEADLQRSTKEIEESGQRELDKNLLAAILQGDTAAPNPEEFARLMSAVSRTEALSGEKLYLFFRQKGPHDLSQTGRSKRAFPHSAIPGNLWQPKDIEGRERTYVSGLMSDLAAKGVLRDEALRWTFDSILFESKEELRYAYQRCIAAASPKWTRANVTPEDIQHIFTALGARENAIRDNEVIESQRQLGANNIKHDHTSLLTALALLDAICCDMDFATLSKLTSLVCRLCVDENVMEHNLTMHAVESLLQKLIDTPDSTSQKHIRERIISDLTTNLKEPSLQVRFLSHLTASSPSAATFRVSLAASFLLGPSRASRMLKRLPKRPPLTTLVRHFSSANVFHVTAKTNFQELTANLSLLDTTIAAGHQSSLGSDADEMAFNQQVDNLADTIHELFTSIADSGASHMRRTEAKDALQALHNRLLFAVRTRKRRKKHIFDTTQPGRSDRRLREIGEVKTDADGKRFMERFLKKEVSKSEEDQEFLDAGEL